MIYSLIKLWEPWGSQQPAIDHDAGVTSLFRNNNERAGNTAWGSAGRGFPTYTQVRQRPTRTGLLTLAGGERLLRQTVISH